MSKETIKEFCREKFIEGTEGYELVIMLLALVRQNKIKENEILDILNYALDYNVNSVYNSLVRARSIAQDELIDNIIKGVD